MVYRMSGGEEDKDDATDDGMVGDSVTRLVRMCCVVFR